MPAFQISDTKAWTIANGMRLAADQYQHFADTATDARVKAQFQKQHDEARELAIMFEGETPLSDHDAMHAIRDLMDGVAWTPSTLDAIAAVMERAGYPIAGC